MPGGAMGSQRAPGGSPGMPGPCPGGPPTPPPMRPGPKMGSPGPTCMPPPPRSGPGSISPVACRATQQVWSVSQPAAHCTDRVPVHGRWQRYSFQVVWCAIRGSASHLGSLVHRRSQAAARQVAPNRLLQCPQGSLVAGSQCRSLLRQQAKQGVGAGQGGLLHDRQKGQCHNCQVVWAEQRNNWPVLRL